MTDTPESNTILVIDDEPVMREFISAALEEEGFDVHQAVDGAQGLALLHTIRCDVVITDLLMPNKEGIETCHELRALNPHVRIIAISGATDAATYFAVLRHMGVAATLFKPFSRDELLNTVQGVLAQA